MVGTREQVPLRSQILLRARHSAPLCAPAVQQYLFILCATITSAAVEQYFDVRMITQLALKSVEQIHAVARHNDE